MLEMSFTPKSRACTLDTDKSFRGDLSIKSYFKDEKIEVQRGEVPQTKVTQVDIGHLSHFKGALSLHLCYCKESRNLLDNSCDSQVSFQSMLPFQLNYFNIDINSCIHFFLFIYKSYSWTFKNIMQY